MSQPIDILVIGLGPAGACAAQIAAEAGLHALAIEKKAVPGAPVQCAEFVPAMIGAEVNALQSTSIQSIGSMITYVENQSPDLMPDFPGRMIDRQQFDQKLAEDASHAGADCRFGIKLRNINQDGTVELSDDTKVRPKVIIGADGPRSVIGASIGSPIRETLETRQINVALRKPFDSTDIFLSQQIPGGYGWAFPKGDTVNIGLGVHSQAKTKLKPLLELLHQKLIDKARVGTKILSHTGGAIPAAGMVKPFGKLGETLCLLAGDAAGLTNPITGAGINSAVISGKLAGKTAAQFLSGASDAATDYAEELEDLFGASLLRALAHRSRLAQFLEKNKQIDPDQLRSGWIAYPDYWQSFNAIKMEKILCPA